MHPFIGLLAGMDSGIGADSGIRAVLSQTPFARGTFFRKETGFGLAFMPFEWEPGAPQLWLVTTVGLLDGNQARRLPQCPSRLELCVAFRRHDLHKPLLDMWHEQSWNLPGLPPEFRCFEETALGVRALLQQGSSFWFGDTIVGGSEWFPGTTGGGLLAPPTAECVAAGLKPWRQSASGVEVKDLEVGSALDRDALTREHDCVFMQYVPLLADEFDIAHGQRFAWEFLLNGLLATDEELDRGLDISHFLTDLDRQSRAPVFRRS